MKNTITVAMLAGMIALPSAVQADEWDFVFAPYLWMADTKGSTVVKGLPANLDVDFFDDIADNLDSGIEFHFEAANRSQGLTYIADVTWLETSSSQYLPSGAKLKPTSSLIIAELKVAGDLFDVPGLQWMAGVRYMESDIELKVSPPGFKFSDDENWVDPVVGIRYAFDLSENLQLGVAGDVGGFELFDGSDLTWSANVALGWEFAENAEAAVGYRVLDVDYSTGSWRNKYEYDARSQGPFAGVIFKF